ncbi:hypothetical protein NZD88_02985 [Chryseobacterium antibioticum]|uniref:Uncharacterized protein n=1 Tax=Chryseobacterium pyrolae TaxID=2987481 RepID=A0ABT2ID18_9FLAO|nr:hypothetical protein [Chryseobacterium pyrolae]MCT2406518.1 hypothetical protein [Chryseobacterium pyrolae]
MPEESIRKLELLQKLHHLSDNVLEKTDLKLTDIQAHFNVAQ